MSVVAFIKEQVVEKYGEKFLVQFGDKVKRKRKKSVDVSFSPPQALPEDESQEGQEYSKIDSQSDLIKVLKSIVTKASKLPYAEPFLYPVDSRVFPEYYEMITNPMDLSTLKEKIPTFESIDTFLNTVTLISGNCVKFNSPGSDIIKDAKKLVTEIKEMVDEKFPKEIKIKEIKPDIIKAEIKADIKAEPEAETNVLETDEIETVNETEIEEVEIKKEKKKISLDVTDIFKLRFFIKSIVTSVMKADYATPFLYPVDASIFPEYYDQIERPMDLSKLRESTATTDSVEYFISNVKLILYNCRAFNLPGSDIIGLAEKTIDAIRIGLHEKLGTRFDPLFKTDDVPYVEKDYIVPSDVPDPLVYTKIKIVLDEFKTYKHVDLFLLPVDLDACHGYFDVVKIPMDISKVEANMNEGLYSYVNGDKFFAKDMRLIFSNCRAYNASTSLIAQKAKSLAITFDILYAKIFGYPVPKVAGRPFAQSKLAMSIQLEGGDEDGGELTIKRPDPELIRTEEHKKEKPEKKQKKEKKQEKEEYDQDDEVEVKEKLIKLFRKIWNHELASHFTFPVDKTEHPSILLTQYFF